MRRRRSGCARRVEGALPAVSAPNVGGVGGDTPRAATWWQGSWQAVGGLFNLLAALVGRWPK